MSSTPRRHVFIFSLSPSSSHQLSQEGHVAVVAALLADHRRHNNIEAENEVEDDEEGEFNRKFKRASADLADSGGTTPLLLAAEVWLDRNLEGKRNHAKFVWSVRLENPI